MFDTPVTVIGNVLTTPEWRRTTNTGTTLVTFRVASTSRRYDKERAVWVDGDSLRVRVACWRRLGENVSLSLQLGDPVIVYGRLYTRDWTDDQGTRRTSYELDALSVGHDLSRGVGKFARRRTAGGTDMVNDEVSAAAIGGEMTEPIEDPGRPEGLPADHHLFEEFDAAIFDIPDAEASSRAAAETDLSAMAREMLVGVTAGAEAGTAGAAGSGSQPGRDAAADGPGGGSGVAAGLGAESGSGTEGGADTGRGSGTGAAAVDGARPGAGSGTGGGGRSRGASRSRANSSAETGV